MRNSEIKQMLRTIYSATTDMVCALFNTLQKVSSFSIAQKTEDWEYYLSDFSDPEVLVELLKDYKILIPSAQGGWEVKEDLMVESRDLKEVILTISVCAVTDEVISLRKKIGKVKRVLN